MIQLRRNGISGEYRGERQEAVLVLRVDIGREDSLDVISGDLLFENGPGSFEHHHSFQTTQPNGLLLQDREDRQILRGTVKMHAAFENVDAGRLDLEIPDTGDLIAIYTFYRFTSFGKQTVLTLTFPMIRTSAFFRRILLEVDQVAGAPLPEPFLSDSLPDRPADLAARQLTFDSIYRDAGVELVTRLGGMDVPVQEAGPDGLWTDEELHAAMANHFQDFQDERAWRLYLLLATSYVNDRVLGIMFDSGDNFPRQGAAVFVEHPAIADSSPAERNREFLYTIVHELGHAFNMLHSFDKGVFDTHGVLPRPGSLSWMNYPQLFPFGHACPEDWDGTSSFWPQFNFCFDRDELAHLRHNDSMEVMMGGRTFGFAGHLEERAFERPSGAEGLSLYLWLPADVEFMQQVVGDVRLKNTGAVAVPVHPDLQVASGHLEVLVRRPADRFPRVVRHFYRLCSRGAAQQLNPGEARYQEINPSFAVRDWLIDEPGTYEVQAVYASHDGRRVVSQVRRVRVVHPSKEADKLAQDYFNQDTGIYLGVEGSRAEGFKKTADQLEEIRQKLSKTPVAEQISQVQALCETRVFKDVRNKRVMRSDRPKAVERLLKTLGADTAKQTVRLDKDEPHLKVNRLLRAATQAYAAGGHADEARAVFGTLESLLRQVNAPPQAVQECQSFKRQVGL